jgi:DNA polymerase-4
MMPETIALSMTYCLPWSKAARRLCSRNGKTTWNDSTRDSTNSSVTSSAADVGRQTRGEGLAGRVVTLKIRFTGFETHTRRQTLEKPTNHDKTIFRTALALTKERAFQNRAVRLIGVGLSDWTSKETNQMDLFATADSGEKDKRLYAALDEIQGCWGKDSLRLGMQRKNPR